MIQLAIFSADAAATEGEDRYPTSGNVSIIKKKKSQSCTSLQNYPDKCCPTAACLDAISDLRNNPALFNVFRPWDRLFQKRIN